MKCSNFYWDFPLLWNLCILCSQVIKRNCIFVRRNTACVCALSILFIEYIKRNYSLFPPFLFFLTWRNIMGTYTMISLPLPYSLAVFNEVGLKLENEIYYYYYSVLLLLLLSCHYIVLFFLFSTRENNGLSYKWHEWKRTAAVVVESVHCILKLVVVDGWFL